MDSKSSQKTLSFDDQRKQTKQRQQQTINQQMHNSKTNSATHPHLPSGASSIFLLNRKPLWMMKGFVGEVFWEIFIKSFRSIFGLTFYCISVCLWDNILTL